ncbi:translation initiation factor IF-2-like [Ursus maritimus]|uniref:Translation initiation factor IF-2-like n=1 Tax=Ursus maritimus TaxID=29073 RepID=A0A8M1GXL3_URSMA|nr:translation initiation factor IF-2-like [Ursus maritimus]
MVKRPSRAPVFTVATVRFLPRVAPLPLSSPRGPPPQAQEEPRPLHRQHLRWGRKHNVAPYFCVQKDFAPSSSNCRRCCPGRLLTCKKVGNAPYSSVPRSTWVTSPRHPCGREASEAAPRASLLSRRRQRLPRPGPARRAGAEIAGDCAVGHSPQSGCATVGLRRGDCDRAGSSQPPATSGNGERCRLCRRRRRGGGGEGEEARTRRTGSASPPGGRHDGEVVAVKPGRPGGGSERGSLPASAASWSPH